MDFDSLIDDSQAQPQQTAASAPAVSAPAPALAEGEGRLPAQATVLPSFDSLEDDEEKYGSAGQQVIAATEGLAKGIAGPLATGAERLLGVNPEDIEARARVNPATHLIAEGVGLVAPAIASMGATALGRAGVTAAAEALPAIEAASKFTQAGALEALAQGSMKALGLEAAEGASALARVGSAALKGSIENAAFQAGDEVSKQILHPDFSADAAASALIDMGAAGLIGGVVTGGIGATAEAWKKLYGKETTGVLNALVNRVGGAEGAPVAEPVAAAISRLGIDVPPEIMASMSTDMELRQIASRLNQSDVSKAGLEYQQTAKDFKQALNDKIMEAMGKDPATLTGEFSEYEAGRRAGEMLSEEYKTKIGPVVERMEAASQKYGGAELGPSIAQKEVEAAKIQHQLEVELAKQGRAMERAVAKNDVEAATRFHANVEQIQQSLKEVAQAAKAPGIVDTISNDIAQLVEKEAWSGSEEIMKEVNRLQRVLPELKTVEALKKQITAVGNNTWNPLGGPLVDAGRKLKSILKEAEINAVARSMGAVEGVEAMNAFAADRAEFAKVARLYDALEDRLNVGGSASAYAKNLKKAANTDAEKFFRRLSGKGDVDLLRFLQENFPETANIIRANHTDKLVADAVRSARVGEGFSPNMVVKKINEMSAKSPELRDFVFPKETLDKVEAYKTIADAITDSSHNYSNTARTVDKLLSDMPAGAAALVTALVSHNPFAAVLVGGLAKTIGKDAPDAVRLALLKTLGSNKPIEAGAFKAAVEFANRVVKGESALNKATAAVFKVGSKVIPEHLMSNETKREKLDKQVSKLEKNPAALLHEDDKTAYYMPEHAEQMSRSVASVTSYLSKIKPQPIKPGVCDKEIPPSKQQVAEYNRALDIAIQPMTVLEHVKNGTLLPSDVGHLKAMYPAVYDRMAQKLQNEMIDHLHGGNSIPYIMRQSMSLFMGQPLDATFKPEAIVAMQATFAPMQAQQTLGGQPKPRSGQTSKLTKLPSHLMTGSQAREARMNKS